MFAPPSARFVRPLAVLAGVLWAAQGLIWTVGPKVQAPEPPFPVLDRPLFTLFWLSIVGAVACSAAVLPGLLRAGHCAAEGLGRAAAVAARVTLAVSGVAALAVVAAGAGVAEEVALSVLPLALNLAGVLLLAALVIAAVALRRAHAFRGPAAVLPTMLAVLMLLTLGAIMASGSSAVAGLVLAVLVVSVHGAAWVTLGWAFRPATAAVPG